MPTLDLVRLGREGSVAVEGDLAPDSPLWDETGLTFSGPVRVQLTAQEAGSAEVLARGKVSGTLARECRRCLTPVESKFNLDVTLIWSDDEETRGDDGQVRPLPAGVDKVDVGEAVREELMLGIPRFVECRRDCRGLCPKCGIDRNEADCDCTLVEPDPRWDALRALKSESE